MTISDGATTADPNSTIGLINNMPDSALEGDGAAVRRACCRPPPSHVRIRFHCFSLPSVQRSAAAQRAYRAATTGISPISAGLRIDGLIVTGAEPIADASAEEPYWRELTDVIDWAEANTRSTIWSCLAAHAAVLHLDGIERHRLAAKCSGVYDCVARLPTIG